MQAGDLSNLGDRVGALDGVVDTDADLVRQLCPVMLGQTSEDCVPKLMLPVHSAGSQSTLHYAGACKANSHVLIVPFSSLQSHFLQHKQAHYFLCK